MLAVLDECKARVARQDRSAVEFTLVALCAKRPAQDVVCECGMRILANYCPTQGYCRIHVVRRVLLGTAQELFVSIWGRHLFCARILYRVFRRELSEVIVALSGNFLRRNGMPLFIPYH